jgi:GT2 family glycosyltransferase
MQQLAIPDGVQWELLVVNNACTDDTDRVVATWQESLPLRRLFEPTPGQTFARNRAMREATGDLILWTDDDVLVDRDWLKALVEAAENWQADVVFGRSVPHWTAAPPEWFSPLHHGRFAVLDYGRTPFVVTTSDTVFYGLNFATRREALLALGGFDESLGYRQNGGAAGEDTDLCQRALASGLKVVYVPDAVVDHVIPDARATKQFYRDRLDSASERDYDRLRESFVHVPWLAGLPRFMVRAAAADALGYLLSTLARKHDQVFDYELKLRRFAGYWRVAARRRHSKVPEGSAA